MNLREVLSPEEIEGFRIVLRNWLSRDSGETQAKWDMLCDMAIEVATEHLGATQSVSSEHGTPRTDALIAKLDADHSTDVAFVWRQMVNLCRHLERELGTEKEDSQRYRQARRGVRDHTFMGHFLDAIDEKAIDAARGAQSESGRRNDEH